MLFSFDSSLALVLAWAQIGRRSVQPFKRIFEMSLFFKAFPGKHGLAFWDDH